MATVRCTRRFCGELRTFETDGQGVVRLAPCPGCARNKAKLCRDCPARLPSHTAMRCAACARRRYLALQRERDRERYTKRRAKCLAWHRRRNEDAAWRAYRAQYMRDYRVANPRNEFDRIYNRVYMATRRADPEYRERQNARKRELRAARQMASKWPSNKAAA